MNKTILALALAALPAAAMADTTLYGTLKMGVENVENGQRNQTNVDDLGSLIGLKGSESLGDGLKAIWQVEATVGMDGTNKKDGPDSGTLGSRNTFVGLQTQYGMARIGHISTYGDSNMEQVNPWNNNSAALGLAAFTRDDVRVKNAIRFDTANFGGFSAAFLYGTKEDFSATGYAPASGNTNRELYNLGLSYENSGFFGKYNYIHQTPLAIASGVSSKAIDSHRIEAGYNANNLLLAVGYRNDKGDASATPIYALATGNNGADALPAFGLDNREYKSQEYALTAAYQLGAFKPKFTYAQSQDVKIDGASQDGTGYKQFIVGVDYTLSKRTVVGMQYGEVKTDKAGLFGAAGEDKLKGFGVNMVHSF
ncbi:porin [Xenophilus sp. AP218F]|nr:porin [Chromobacterium sp. ASV5]OWY37355.1 porin [Xenophilus sp. AP218F]